MIHVGDKTKDKLQLAMDATFGVKEAMSRAKPFLLRGRPSLSQAYATISGDSCLRYLEYGGLRGTPSLSPFLMREAADNIQSSDFPNILLNSMTKRLIQDYAEVPMGGLEKVYIKGEFADYKMQDRVRMGYLLDLPTVTDGSNYTEFAKPTDELIQYSPVKLGNILSITEETIRNDDLGQITRFTERMARAARRTVKQFITNFFLTNPNYGPDGVAWFNAAHNNLLALPLTPDALTAARAGMKLQTEKDSNKPLSLQLSWLMFAPALWATARAINQTDKWPTGPGTFEGNPWYHAFGANDEGLIENELLTQPNDWFFGCWSSECACIEVGFLDGEEVPRMYFNNDPSSGAQPFSKDEIQFKVKHVFGGNMLDFRGVGYSANH